MRENRGRRKWSNKKRRVKTNMTKLIKRGKGIK